MNIVTDIKNWQEIRKDLTGKTIGFVPTMGNLHDGHLSLCKQSKQENDVTVISIFVNPTQFNQQDDFDSYPRTLDADISLLKSMDIDYILQPTQQALYPDNFQMSLQENHLSLELEGQARPGHFNGMMTIVLKLLNLAQASKAYFGEKDYQQLLLVRKMVDSFFIPTKIIACPTVRAEDGLALSSRNSRLTPQQREVAQHLPRLLQSNLNIDEISRNLTSYGFKVDYIAEKWGRRLGAAWLENVRLIDNIPIKSDKTHNP